MSGDPTFWTALGSLAGVAMLGAALVAHMMRSSEDKGHMRARIESLEKGQGDIVSAGKIVATLEVTVRVLSEAVTNLDHTVSDILQGRIAPLRRRQTEQD